MEDTRRYRFVGEFCDAMAAYDLKSCINQDGSLNANSILGHSLDVAMMVSAICKEERSICVEQRIGMEYGAIVHDLGKLAIQGCIIGDDRYVEPCSLAMKEIEQHPLHGLHMLAYAALNDIRSDDPVFTPTQHFIELVITGYHHRFKRDEKRRYPDEDILKQLIPEEVSSQSAVCLEEAKEMARIVAFCDAFSALTAKRCYFDSRDSVENPSNVHRLFLSGLERARAIVPKEIEVTRKFGSRAIEILSENYKNRQNEHIEFGFFRQVI